MMQVGGAGTVAGGGECCVGWMRWVGVLDVTEW